MSDDLVQLTNGVATKLPIGTPVTIVTGRGDDYLKAKCLLVKIGECACEVQITEIIEQGKGNIHVDEDLVVAPYGELFLE